MTSLEVWQYRVSARANINDEKISEKKVLKIIPKCFGSNEAIWAFDLSLLWRLIYYNLQLQERNYFTVKQFHHLLLCTLGIKQENVIAHLFHFANSIIDGISKIATTSMLTWKVDRWLILSLSCIILSNIKIIRHLKFHFMFNKFIISLTLI